MIMETTRARNVKENSKINLYLPILDGIILEVRNRFDYKNLDLMRTLRCCYPSSSHFLQNWSFAPLVESYSCLNNDYLTLECALVKQTLQNKEMKNIIDVLQEVYQLQAAFPILVKLLQVAFTIVVNTAECKW